MSTFTRSGLFTPFTPVFNASGQPGISLPLFHGEDGLPLGVQLVGRPAGEAALLALAAQLEEARPGVKRLLRSQQGADMRGAATGRLANYPAGARRDAEPRFRNWCSSVRVRRVRW
jgi:hypothetical protein